MDAKGSIFEAQTKQPATPWPLAKWNRSALEAFFRTEETPLGDACADAKRPNSAYA